MIEENSEVRDPSVLLRCLWGDQLISSLGTQTSLCGIGLRLFAQSDDLLDFGLAALGWRARIPLAEGLESTVTLFRHQLARQLVRL